MSEGIIIAIISCFGTVFGAILVFIAQIKKLRLDQTKHSDALKSSIDSQLKTMHNEVLSIKSEFNTNALLTQEKLLQLEKKQDKHNQLIERMYHVETEVEVLKNRESVSEHRIEDLERMENDDKK